MEVLYATADVDERVALARHLGHDDVLILFTTHRPEEAPLRDRARAAGAKIGLLTENPQRTRGAARQYDAHIGLPRRDHFESKALTHILDPEAQQRPDFIHHRNSGLNQVLLKLASARGIQLISTLATLRARPEERLGRLQQNLRWEKKYRVAHHLTSGARSWHEQRAHSDLLALKRELHRQNI